MFFFFLSAAALPVADPIAACTAAVHGQRAQAVTACKAPRVDLWKDDGPSPDCGAALSLGSEIGRSTLPPVMLAGMVREYDKRALACHAPAARPSGPDRTTSQRLWD
jgi:hypothetical protein